MKSGAAGQMTLFGAQMDVNRAVKAALADALKGCRLSRPQVVSEINRILAAEGSTLSITLPSLEKWCAPSADHTPPVWVLPAICRVTGSLRPLEALAAPLGVSLVGDRERQYIELGKAQIDAKKLARRKRRALEALEEMGE